MSRTARTSAARRLEDILKARDGGVDGSLADACAEQLRYYDWPCLSLRWDEADWVAALAEAGGVFDSSRMVLTSIGLAENEADDYSKFMRRSSFRSPRRASRRSCSTTPATRRRIALAGP